MKKEEKTELTKANILSAAMEEFGTNGYNGSSLNNICAKGIAKGLLYHNYKSKDALYLACVERCFCTMTEYFKACEIGTDLRKYTEARLCFFREHTLEARLFFEAILQPPNLLKEQILDIRRDYDTFTQDLCERILDTVLLRPNVTKEDAMRYFKLMQDMFNGYFSSPTFRELSFSDTMAMHEQELLKILDYMLYGIAESENGK